MLTYRFMLSVYLGVLSTIPTLAQTPAPIALSSSPLQTVFATLGGSSTSLPISYIGTGTFTELGGDGSSTAYALSIEATGPDKFRWVLSGAAGSITNIINGQSGQTQTPNGIEAIASSEFFGHSIANFPVLALGEWLNIPTVQAYFLGPEIIRGQSLNHVAISGLSGSVQPPDRLNQAPNDRCEVYVDPQTSLPVILRYYVKATNAFVPSYLPAFVTIDVAFSNFQQVNGLSFPFTVTRYLGDQQLSVIQLESLQLNVPVNLQDFTLN